MSDVIRHSEINPDDKVYDSSGTDHYRWILVLSLLVAVKSAVDASIYMLSVFLIITGLNVRCPHRNDDLQMKYQHV